MRVFFNGLNELRAIAALAVVFHHLELLKKQIAQPSLYQTNLKDFVGGLGKNGVYLFFVLSGFLITYLLLAELKKSQTIQIRFFYLRRILRIWPLYYFIVVICFFILPMALRAFPDFMGGIYYAERIQALGQDFWPPLLLFLFFLPNLALIIHTPVAGAAQLWSVGVEEQFYLLWPLLMKTFRRNIQWILLMILVGKPGSLLIMERIGLNTQPMWSTLYEFLESLKIELMAMGGIGAWLLHKNYLSSVIPAFRRWHTVILISLLIPALYFNVHYLLMGVLFISLIVLNVHDQSRVISNKPLSFLGDISYGIYMYHPIVMYLAFCTTRSLFGLGSPLVFNLMLYALTIGLTIGLSHLSFRYFESSFMRFKERFVVVASGKK